MRIWRLRAALGSLDAAELGGTGTQQHSASAARVAPWPSSGCGPCTKWLQGSRATWGGGTGEHTALLPVQLVQPANSSEAVPERALERHKLKLSPKVVNTLQTMG